jgi:hypothetical protein
VTYSEHEAQRILARAAELEGASGTRFTAEDIRQIAATADIDPHALERAMNETGHVTARPVSPETVPMSAKRLAMLAGAGAVLGALAIAADTKPFGRLSEIVIFGPSALFTVYLALRHSLRGGFSGLLRELGVVLGSFTLAIIASEGIRNASPAITWSLVCGALGTAILSIRGGARVIFPTTDDGALTDGR